MPKAKQKSSTGLSIELGEGIKYFTVGSNVSGDVVLDTAEDFAIGSVSIEFYGRVKVHYVQSHGQGESPWRGRTPLFSESRLLYEGFHTHRPGSFRWPFTFEIPTHPDLAVVKQSKDQWKEQVPYLSTEDYIAAHPMPATFDFRKFGFGYRWHIFVEYVLKAEVKQAEGSRVLLPPSSRKATLPVLIKEVAREDSQVHSLPLSAQFILPDQLMEKNHSNGVRSGQSQLVSQDFTQTVRSSRLTMQISSQASTAGRSSFSFREKTRQIFNSSSLPRYTFEVSVSTPQSIQSLRRDVFPFVISVSTVENADSTTIMPEDYPDVRIDNVTVYLTAITYLRCKGPFKPKPAEYEIQLLERQPVDYIFDMKPQMYSSASSKASQWDNGGPTSQDRAATRHSVDISRLPGASLAVIAATMGKQTEKPLSPSFNTYIIAREYKLKWRLELDVAGEKVKLRSKFDIPVKVLPPERRDLNSIMAEEGVTGAENHDDEDEDAGFDEQEAIGSTSLGNLTKSHTNSRTKQEEAEEDRDVAGPSNRALEYRHDELLPSYQQGPSDFGYRHEIDEGPPGYEKE